MLVKFGSLRRMIRYLVFVPAIIMFKVFFVVVLVFFLNFVGFILTGGKLLLQQAHVSRNFDGIKQVLSDLFCLLVG